MPKRSLSSMHCDEESRGVRTKLPSFTSYSDVIQAISKAKNIVVLCGAGISTSSGIPDFRSSDGIYKIVEDMNLALDDPQQLFDIDFFRENPEPFYQFAHRLYPKGILPSKTHYFLAKLEKEKKLRRVFTQNIDGLEAAAGVSKVVPCHGSLATVSCTGLCKNKHIDISHIATRIEAGEVPLCEKCQSVMKPDVTFFGESLPNEVKRYISQDRDKVDLLLVMGTSLQVRPMSHLVNFFPCNVPQVLINLTPVLPLKNLSEGWDVSLLGPCDDIITQLLHSLEWIEKEDTVSAVGMVVSDVDAREWRLGGLKDEIKMDDSRPPTPGEFVEVVTCDLCGEQTSEGGYSCTVCFDYDLCRICFNGGRNNHSKTARHKFKKF